MGLGKRTLTVINLRVQVEKTFTPTRREKRLPRTVFSKYQIAYTFTQCTIHYVCSVCYSDIINVR